MIEGIEAFELRLEPPQATGRTISYQMNLRNTGTRPLQLAVEGSNPEGRVEFKFPDVGEIDVGREAVVPIAVGVKRSALIGSPETFDFRVDARPVGTTTGGRTFDARLVHKPMLSRRVPVIAGFFAALIASMLLLVAWAPRHVEGFPHWSGCKVHNGPELRGGTASPSRRSPPRPHLSQRLPWNAPRRPRLPARTTPREFPPSQG